MIILITGTDAFRAQQYRATLLAQAREQYGNGLIVQRIACGESEDTIERLANVSASGSLFSSRTLVVIEDPLLEAAALVDFFEHQPTLVTAQDTVFVFIAPIQKASRGRAKSNGNAAANGAAAATNETHKALLEYLAKHAKAVKRFNLMTEAELAAWLTQYAAQHNISIERAAAAIISQASTDTWHAVSILERVAAYAGGSTITAATVRALVAERIESRVFNFLDALAARQAGPALTALHRELAAGSAPLQLVAMLAYQLRVLTITRSLLDKKVPFAKLAGQADLNPFVVQKAARAADRFTLAELQELYTRLTELQLSLRRSPLPAATLLEQFVFRVAASFPSVA